MISYIKFFSVLQVVILISIAGSGCDSPQSHLDSGDRLFNQGNYSQALEEYSQAARLAPASAEAFHSRGRSYLHLDTMIRRSPISTRLSG